MKALPAVLLDALASTAAATGEYRALTIYDAPPGDCGTFLVEGDAFAPHLKDGELALIDPDDNVPVSGEIYLLMIPSPMAPGGYRLRIVQLRRSADEPSHWWVGFALRRPVIRVFPTMEAAEARPVSGVLSDGPMNERGVQRRIIGRVVGVMGAQPPPA